MINKDYSFTVLHSGIGGELDRQEFTTLEFAQAYVRKISDILYPSDKIEILERW